MKFYLFKDEPVHIPMPEETWKEINAEISTTVTQLTPIISEKESKQGEFWDYDTVKKCADALITKLKRVSIPIRLYPADPALTGELVDSMDTIETKIVIWVVNEDDGRSAQFGSLNDRLFLSVRLLELEGCFLDRVRRMCDDKAKLSFELFFTPPLSPTLAGVVAMDLELDQDVNHNYTVCSARHMPVTSKMEEYWNRLKSVDWRMFGENQWTTELLRARCNVVLQIKDHCHLFADILSCPGTNHRLLNEAMFSDFEVVTAAGTAIKCHKSILMAGSPVLFTKISELATNRLEIGDMSDAGVHAFIFYVYFGEQNELGWNWDIALELFKAGYKYCVSRLKSRMKEYFLKTPNVLVSSDQAIKLLPHVINNWNESALEEKLIGILRQEDAITNENYRQFFREHPQVATKLRG